MVNANGAVANTEVAVVNPDGKKCVKAKASDYDRGTRSVIETAIEFYCATLLCNDPYAQPVKEMDWARVAWDKARLHHQVTIPHDIVILKLVSLSLSYNSCVARWEMIFAVLDHCAHISSTGPVQGKCPCCRHGSVWV